MSVTDINSKRMRLLREQFDELVSEAKTVCLVTVTRDGKVSYMMPDNTEHDLELVGALNAAALILTDRVLTDED
jgi:hypothetical protein